MKIIDVAICINNKDPKGIGRIRYIPYGQYKSEIERALDYTDWDERDPFIAIPFLPAHINVIPQIRQSIKLIKYDTAKDTQNVEYVAGPFSTPHDFGSETFAPQHKHTTYGGVIIKDLPDVRDNLGGYVDKKSEATLSNLNDIGIYGNYGSNLIFTENGLILRGGTLIDKATKNNKNAQRLKDVPLRSDKISKISLKKFAQTLSMVEEPVSDERILISKVKYLVEYDLDSLTTPSKIRLYAYKIINPIGTKFDTDRFNESTDVVTTDTNTYRLINTDGTTSTPTYTIDVENLKSAYSEIRSFLYIIDNKNLSEFNYAYPTEDLHPFYFRPTKEFKLRETTTNTEKENRLEFIDNVTLRKKTGNALIFSKTNVDAPTIKKSSTEKVLKTNEGKGEQSFAAITADIIYQLSTDANKGTNTKSINFNSLDPYEYTQDDYLNKINPNTYAVVRGEVLIDLIQILYEFLKGHVHNINKPAIYKPDIEDKLENMIKNLNTELVNNSIRIN